MKRPAHVRRRLALIGPVAVSFALGIACGPNPTPGPVPVPHKGTNPSAANSPPTSGWDAPNPDAIGGPHIAPDRSLTPLDYMGVGMPIPNRPWAVEDYQTAIVVLQEIAKHDPAQLPRFKSRQSGQVFDRLTASENFANLSDESLAVGARFNATLALHGPIRGLIDIYNRASQAGLGSFDFELVESAHTSLRLLVITANLADEFAATADVPPAERERRAQAVERLRDAFELNVKSSLEFFTVSRHGFRDAALDAWSNHLANTLPRLWRAMPEDAQVRQIRRVREIIAAEQVPAIRQNLSDLLRFVPEVPGGTRLPAGPSNGDNSGSAMRRVHRENAGTPGVDGWIEAFASQGNFSVLVPAPFTDSTITASVAGTTVHTHLIEAVTSDGIEFTASMTERATTPDGRPFAEFFTERVRQSGTVKAEFSYTHIGPPSAEGTEIRLETAERETIVRIVQVGVHGYMLNLAYPKTARAAAQKLEMQFLDSLTIAR